MSTTASPIQPWSPEDIEDIDDPMIEPPPPRGSWGRRVREIVAEHGGDVEAALAWYMANESDAEVYGKNFVETVHMAFRDEAAD